MQLHPTDDPILLSAKNLWVFPDGTTLPVVSGGDGDGGAGSGDGGSEGGSGSGSGSGDGGAGGGSGSGQGSGGSGSGSGDGGQGSGGADDKGFPADTPLEQMTEPQRTAYWKFQARKHEARSKERGDYEDLKAKAGQYDELVNATKGENERAVENARKEEREKAAKEERDKAAPKLVDAEMRAAAAGRIPAEKLKELLEPLDRTKFLDPDTGEVDLEKVATYINSVVPDSSGNGKGGFPDLGQGRRSTGGKPSVASGAERYAQRHPAKKS